MTESMPMLKSSRANYIFISDNGFIKRNGYFFKERIQIVSMKWPVNIGTYLQFLDNRKFWTQPYTYFVLTLLNFRPTSKFCKPTRLFVQVYITFYDLKFKLKMMNIMLQMTNIITLQMANIVSVTRGKGKSLESFLPEKFLVIYQHSLVGLAMKVNNT